MGYKYKVADDNGIYFVTTTVVNWIDVFTRKEFAEVIIEALNIAKEKKV